MKELVVISGKGGTGKTSIVAAFAALAENAVLADCDVDAADLHLVLNPAVESREPFSGGRRARIDPEKCVACGRCQTVCRFDAISFDGPPSEVVARTYRVDPFGCEGCGLCDYICPAGAVIFEEAINGEWFRSQTRFGPLVHARLGVAEENSGKLVTLVRNEARERAEKDGRSLLIVDGSPGIGCPVIASITGSDMVLVVTEPTLSGLHDLERVCELSRHFGIPTLVCVNKWDLNPELAERIEGLAREAGAEPVGRVSYDEAVTRAQIAERSVVECDGSRAAEEVEALWGTVRERLNRT